MKREKAAFIDESRCIGCALCLEACPVDAIVGAQGLMHTVVESWCIGCALCVAPCPVDCIAMVRPRGAWNETLKRAAAQRARRRRIRSKGETLHTSDAATRKRVLAELLARRRE